MGCTRNRSRIWADCVALFALFLTFFFPSSLWAAFASQFSFSTGEEYNDNIFFSKNKDHDFITFFTPTLKLLYAPEGQVTPTAIAEISPSYQLYARHRELNNFDNVSANLAYAKQYSPRLNFNFVDSFQGTGKTRTGNESLFGFDESLTGSSSTPPVEKAPIPNLSQTITPLVTPGRQATNSVSLQGSYLYREDIRFSGAYTNSFTSFIDAGGSEFDQSLGASGVYKWNEEHNLHAGYTISVNNPRDGSSSVVHSFDLGDDYFSQYNLQLTPTFSLAASTGLSFNTSSEGPRVANNTRVTLTKLWETAQLNGGLRKGLTPSFGVAGTSDTTTLFTNFTWFVSERLSTNSFAVFSFFDTDEVNFKTFQAGLGLNYLLTSWISTGLHYRFNWLNSGAGASKTETLEKGTVKSNIVFLSATVRFDIWPNVGLSRSTSSPVVPMLKPPFPVRGSKPSP